MAMSGESVSNENERTTSRSAPFIFTQPHVTHDEGTSAPAAMMLVVDLTADERTKSRHYFEAHLESQRDPDLKQGGTPNTDAQKYGIYVRLPRGTVLRHNDYLTTADKDAILRIVAKPEPVMTAIAPDPHLLLKAAYHLGNRHVELEVNLNYLRFSPDPVLKQMVEQMGLNITEATLPFQPEAGAYANHGSHSHHHDH